MMNLRLLLAATALVAANPSLSAVPATAAAKWSAECGACHVAYPAKFLPAATWSRIMAGLDKHFGSDASLDATASQEIAAYLAANAGTGKHGEDPKTLRISDTGWFRHQHSEEMDPAIFKSKLVKSAANCGACHTTVAKGNYSEHNVRIPGQARGKRHHEREDDDD